MFARRDKHYPCRSGQTSLATAVAKFTKPVTKNYFGPSTFKIHREDKIGVDFFSTIFSPSSFNHFNKVGDRAVWPGNWEIENGSLAPAAAAARAEFLNDGR